MWVDSVAGVLLAGAVLLGAVGAGLRAEENRAGAVTQKAGLESKEVVENGISAVLKFPKAAISSNEDFGFSVVLKNTSNKTWILYDARYQWEWEVLFTNLETKSVWKVQPLFEAERVPSETWLKAGASIEFPAQLDESSGRFQFVMEKDGKVERSPTLKPGKYTLQVKIRVNPNAERKTEFHWSGVIKTGEVEFEVTEAVK